MRRVYTGLLVLVLGATLVGLLLAFGLGTFIPGLGRLDPALERIPAGVTFETAEVSLALGGLSRYAVTGLLEEFAPPFSHPPQNAYLDASTKGAVPGLDGYHLDVAAIVALAASASPGRSVGPVYYRVPITVTLDDFPAAPVYQGSPNRQAVAVILNIAWGDEHLDPITALVERAGGRLTICPVGAWLDGNSDRAAWLGAAASRGHEIGNHGYHNQPMTYSDPELILREIDATSDLIEAACGRRPPIFAPPMGAISKAMLEVAAGGGYRTVLWSLDTIDWRLEGIETIAARVISRVGPGDIILCHPTPQTGPAMELFLPVLAEKGLEIITLSELLSPGLSLDLPAAPDQGAPP